MACGLGFQPLLFALQQIVELDHQFVKFGGVLFFDDAIAEGSDFVFFLACHGD